MKDGEKCGFFFFVQDKGSGHLFLGNIMKLLVF